MKAIFWVGKGTIFDGAIRAFKRGGVSHSEIMFSDGFCGTSYPGVGVVLRPLVVRPEDWVILELPCTPEEEAKVRAFFVEEAGCGYDWLGIVFAQVLGWHWQSKTKYFCSETTIAALQRIYTVLNGLKAWREDPASVLVILAERVLGPDRWVKP